MSLPLTFFQGLPLSRDVVSCSDAVKDVLKACELSPNTATRMIRELGSLAKAKKATATTHRVGPREELFGKGLHQPHARVLCAPLFS